MTDLPTPPASNPAASAAAPPSITGFELGPFFTNSYVIVPPPPASPPAQGTKSPCWIIDPSFEPDSLIDFVRQNNLEPEAIVLTHAHVDHIAGIPAVRAAFPNIPIWIHAAEADWLTDPNLNLSAMGGMPISTVPPTRLLTHGDVLTLGSTQWKVLHTPGHSPGNIALHHEPSHQVLVGDTLFSGSIGRTDFPGSDLSTLMDSITTQLYTLPTQTRVFPGHGPATSIAREKRTNPFVRG